MFAISKEIEFDAGHRVPLHESKCKNPHGHRYRVVAYIEGDLITEGPESGMVRDFSVVKQLLVDLVHDKYDHGFIVHEDDLDVLEAFQVILTNEGYRSNLDFKVIVVPFIPTAECLAKGIYDDMKPHLPNLFKVEVWETPTSCAEYIRMD
jgi:6-pyruvoyltetrahydropterin/6-carboxytetrahydropterin synthase